MEAVKNFGSISYINFGTFLKKKLFVRFNTASTEGQKWINQLPFGLNKDPKAQEDPNKKVNYGGCVNAGAKLFQQKSSNRMI